MKGENKAMSEVYKYVLYMKGENKAMSEVYKYVYERRK